VAPGQCVPLAIGSKPKQSLRTKLDALLQNAPVPSAIGSAFFQHARRFDAGHAPANPLEAEVFGFFGSLSPDMRSILACSVASFDGIAAGERDRLFDPSISQDPNAALDAETLATAFVRELKQRVRRRRVRRPPRARSGAPRPQPLLRHVRRRELRHPAAHLQGQRPAHERVRARAEPG
jgi:hypothetical protein